MLTDFEPASTAARTLERALGAIRPSVRAEKPYVVGGVAEPEVKLNQNESPYDLPGPAKRALFEAFMAVPFNRYPAEQPFARREALAARHGIDPACVIVGNGSNELTYTIGLCLISPGTPVVLPRPMFSLYEKVVALHGGRLVPVAPKADYGFDVDALEAAIRREQPAYAVVTTPNNPTGRAVAFADVVRLAEASEGFLVVDEAYAEFMPDVPSATTLLESHPNVIVLRTFSKAFGLAGLRVGYLVMHPAVAEEFMKARLPFVVDPLSERVALALLNEPGLLVETNADLRARTQALYAEVAARPGVEVVPSEANFFLFRTAMGGKPLQDGLAAHGISVRSMGGYPELPRFVRVSAGTGAENRRFLTALDAVIADAAPV